MSSTIRASFQLVYRFDVLFSQTDVEESGGVFIGLFKCETINNIVAFGSNVIVYMNFITNVWPKIVVIGPAEWQLGRYIIGYDDDPARIIGTSESIQIGVIS